MKPLHASQVTPGARRLRPRTARGSHRAASSLAALLLSACSSGVGVDVPRLVLPNDPVNLGSVPHGELSRHTIQIGNAGSARLSLRLGVDAPFTLLTDRLEIGPNSTRELNLRVLPVDYFNIEADLHVASGPARRVLRLLIHVDPDNDSDGFLALDAGGDDCDDTRADIFPGAPEWCDGVDNSCDGLIDVDAIDSDIAYRDADRDTFGDPDQAQEVCQVPSGFVLDNTDCDDTRADIFPGAFEIADGVDQNCNGMIDEHLLVTRSIVFTEVRPADAGSGDGYLELRARASSPLFLQQVEVEVGGSSGLLPPLVLEDGDMALLCGLDTAGTIDGTPCDGPLPGPVHSGDTLTLTAVQTFETLDLSEQRFEIERSQELAPTRALSGLSGDPTSWCASTVPLGDAGFGTPGTLDGHCETEP